MTGPPSLLRLCLVAFGIQSTVSQSLAAIWQHHDHPYQIDKWLEYAANYQRHFPRPNKETVRLLEIGVQSGGSLIAWKKYYGSNSTIVGIDIDVRCKRSHDPEHNIFVEIGSQLDPAFLSTVCKKYGPFDIIVDDGGHTDNMITTSLFHLYPSDDCLKRNGGVYSVEDLHTMVMKLYMASHEPITKEIIGNAFLGMHAHWDANADASKYSSFFRDNVAAIHLYDSHLFLVKGRVSKLTRNTRGNDFFPNNELALNKVGTYSDDKIPTVKQKKRRCICTESNLV